MNSELDIARKLKESMRTSCDDVHYFSDDEAELVNAEYLITVNAAKAIQELNTCFGTPYKIRLEAHVKTFSASCTPLMARILDPDGLPRKSVIRKVRPAADSRRIDIAIYRDQNSIDIPVCAIEVKGFDPSANLITKDLERNSEYFWLKSNTGDSMLPFTFFIALHSYKNVLNDNKENRNIDKIKGRYQGYIERSPILNRLHHDIDVFTIRRGIVPDVDDLYDENHELQGDEDYHFIGVVVTTKRKAGD